MDLVKVFLSQNIENSQTDMARRNAFACEAKLLASFPPSVFINYRTQ